MRTLTVPVLTNHHHYHLSLLHFPSSLTNSSTSTTTFPALLPPQPPKLLHHNPKCSNSDTLFSKNDVDDDGDDYDGVSLGDHHDDQELKDASGGVCIEIKKLGSNSRRIRSRIAVNASLDAVWKILTDYEKLSDFIPGLAVSRLIDKNDNFARLYQVGQQNLAFGLKFNAKAILDCYERDLQVLDSGRVKRDIDFKMTEGDFQFFEGKWSIEQTCRPRSEGGSQGIETTLSYFVEVKPKLWLPVHLVEGRLCKEIKTNLSCIREEAQKLICDTVPE